jgi:hypothetical protein
MIYDWSDAVPQRFLLHADGYNLETTGSPEIGVWYRSTIDYQAASSTVDWRVEEAATGAPFHELLGAPFALSSGFNRLYVGELSKPPKYGEHAAIRIDNIVVSLPATPAEQMSRGSIKSKYR